MKRGEGEVLKERGEIWRDREEEGIQEAELIIMEGRLFIIFQ